MSTNKIPVAEITIKRIESAPAFGQIQPDQSESIISRRLFDVQGNKIREIFFDRDAQEEQVHTLEYHADGKIAKETIQYILDDIEESTCYFYEENLLVKKVKTFGFGGESHTKIAYNDDGLISAIVVCNDEGETEEQQTFEYSGKLLLKHTKLNESGKPEFEVEYLYDDQGRVIQEKQWTAEHQQAYTSVYHYEKDEEEPDFKVINDKQQVVEAVIKTFDDKKRLTHVEIQRVHDGGLVRYFTNNIYDDNNKLTSTETTNDKGRLERKQIIGYNEHGLIALEIKSEFEILNGNINSFTLVYDYVLHHQ